MFEDSKNMRKSVELYFSDSEQVFIAQSFANANNAVKHVRNFKPDIVLMDIDMPGVSGIEALEQIKVAQPEVKVMMMTIFDDADKIFAALRNGASGYMLKNFDNEDAPDKLEQAILDVNKGGGFMSPTIAAKVMRSIEDAAKKTHYVALTDRQKDVLECMVKGMNRKMVAAHLHITVDTVGDHIKEIYKKLHVNSASEAVREAILRKIV